MSELFSGAASFNVNISNWDVSSVTNMDNMFYGATDFNQNLSGWNVVGIASTGPTDFNTGSAIVGTHLPNWGTASGADTTAPVISGPSGSPGDASSSITVSENATTIYTLTADESVTWHITGGADSIT